MIILDERDTLGKLFEAQGFQILDFFENKQILSCKEFCSLPLQRRSDFLLVDTQTVLNHSELQESLKPILNTFLGVIFFHDHQNVEAQEWVQDQAAFLTKIIGEYSLPMPQLQWTMLSNQLQFFWNLMEEQKSLQSHMVSFSNELNQLLQTTEVEMKRSKKIHELLIPKRNDEIRGISFLSRYAAGDGGGGEFYDLHQSGNKIFQILISSQSYLISSSLLGVLNIHKQKKFNADAFLADSKAEIELINSAKVKKSHALVTLLEIDPVNLQLKVYGKGKTELFSQKNGSLSIENDSHYQLSKGEKLFVLSPGFTFNWKEGKISQDIYTFLNSHQQLNNQELLMELFFQLRQGNSSQFLNSDATVVMMEVNRHGMHQI